MADDKTPGVLERSAAAHAAFLARPTPSLSDVRPLWRTFLAFLGPMVLSNGLQALSGTFNNIFVGQMLGTDALAAVSAAFPIIFFLIALVIGIGAGASVLIGQAWGAREVEKAKAIAGTALALGLMLGLSIALFGGLFTEDVLQWLHTPAEILPQAVAYGRLMMFAMPGLLVFILSTQLLRGVGDTVTPLYALLLSTATSGLLTPAFIRGWAGLPRLGATSAAAASICAFGLALVFLALYLRRIRHPLAPDRELLRALRIDRRLLVLVVRIGLPTGLQVIVLSLSEIALLALINRFGSAATAAYGAVNQVINYVQFPALSIAISASILGAQAIGAGNPDRLRAIARTGLQLNLFLTGGLAVLTYLISGHLLSLFIVNAPVVATAQSLLHIMLCSSVIYGFSAVLSGVMRASGVVVIPTSISILCILAIEIPVAYSLAPHYGLKGIWLSYPIAFLCMLAIQAAYYVLVWRKQKVERLV